MEVIKTVQYNELLQVLCFYDDDLCLSFYYQNDMKLKTVNVFKAS